MRLVNTILRAVIGLLIATLVVSVGMGVFYRYVLKESLYWATEVPNVLLIWIVFLGSVVAFYEKRHIAFSVLAEALPAPLSRLICIIAEIIVLGFFVIMLVYGWQIVTQAMNSLSDALKIPRGYFYLCLPISAALMAACSVENLVKLVRHPAPGRPS
ncbi:TRAP transporter small permease [Aquibium carbonis]|uniref:TRAP transporter small permease protein n=1 Tax=Aquibium carbonis TaxID=2495581 RepID=A0A3R9ZX56_9HYPH|nr:TRAP transporter small permease [Aquibium carbonis]RST83911.1 TRAP transporter small permease [Aquibium carbonis]